MLYTREREIFFFKWKKINPLGKIYSFATCEKNSSGQHYEALCLND